ncbi:hypothetical protein GPECTOR_42g798 [Gonium pectorale]|uniref:Protein kinase domain-containing protein n=1 Tax=Gonium pectorale TaxID=33097 RepID=A0A150G9R7_GONPE|nr:hypothetical protein GPECTOR_42g798 [Gonium pectorale]|eukprot:KXZ46587.1 hypothetical protein GPECTOR_42g798 [Gonium pectorale]
MPGTSRAGSGLSGSSWGRKQAGGKAEEPLRASKSAKPVKRVSAPKPVPSKKPQRTVKLLEDSPCFLSECPAWVKAPTLWSPRLSPRRVDVSLLGSGRHGSSVLRVRHRTLAGAEAVVKQFARERLLAVPRLHDKVRQTVLNEWRVHSALVPHPNVVPLYGAHEDKSYVTLIMEAQRGDLLSFLDEQDRDVLSEDEARGVVADVLSALEHMHSLGFVHRDVKAENVFAEPVGPSGRGGGGEGGGGVCWRLGDLGSAVEVAAVMEPGGPGLHLEGSPPFLAPEYAALWAAPPASRTTQQLQRATSPKQDVWAVGALLYDALVGHAPFSGPDPATEPPLPQLAAAIVGGEPCPSPAAAGLSPAAVDFIAAALRKDPSQRPSAAQLLGHPWITGAT